MDPSTCYLLYKVNAFAQKLMRSRYQLIQAFGGMVINFLMAYCFAIVMQAGLKEANRRKKKKWQTRKNVQTVSRKSELVKQRVRSADATSK